VRLIVFGDDYRVGVSTPEGVVDVSAVVSGVPARLAHYRMQLLIQDFERLRPRIEARAINDERQHIDPRYWKPPTPTPRNFLAAPLNYHQHRREMSGSIVDGHLTARELGFFVKAGGSLSAPYSAIALPNLPGRRFDHEAEVALVIGREARGVSPSSALDHVFGYTLVVDVTMRVSATGQEERPMRKSYWTFSPCGPCIVTADEIPDPSTLEVTLWVNGELRQRGTLADLIVNIPGLISAASAVLPLEPGDLYATGTPEGVGPIEAGDEVIVECQAIGRMILPVTSREW